MAHVEWNEVALAPGVRALAELLRRRFGVWVGVVSASGTIVHLGAETQPDLRRGPGLCSRVSANPGRINGSCRGSLQEWGELDDANVHFLRCHAGLSSIVLPIDAPRPASLYVSGFFDGESAFEQGEAVRSVLAELDYDSEERQAAVGAVTHLDRGDRELVRVVVQELAERIRRALDDSIVEDSQAFEGMIGRSPAMLRLFETIRKIARSNSTVLIEGENGTGKELVARAIHRRSRRADTPLITQNCAAIPSELIESELFGHKKGAFSGAHRDREGLFSAADGGTFFLDEIGDMRTSLQVKLLRILQEGTFLPVGDENFRKVDVRIICATNRDLEELVEAGQFREDLDRIRVITVEPPPLRHRREDIPLLARHFVAKASRLHGRKQKKIDTDAMEALEQHAWPGNVRELENEIERAVIMSGQEPVIEVDDFRLRTPPRSKTIADVARSGEKLPDVIETVERTMILEGLKRTGWNKTQTAKELGISRRNLIRKVAAFELEDNRSS